MEKTEKKTVVKGKSGEVKTEENGGKKETPKKANGLARLQERLKRYEARLQRTQEKIKVVKEKIAGLSKEGKDDANGKAPGY